MVNPEIFRHANYKIKDFSTSEVLSHIIKTFEPQIKTIGGELTYKGYSNILGVNIKINNIQNKNVDIFLYSDYKVGEKLSFSVMVQELTGKGNILYNLSEFTNVFATDIEGKATGNIKDQYKTLLKTFFNKINVDVFKLAKTYKTEGVEPVIFKFIQEFCRTANTYLISTSNEEILLNAVYTKKIITRYLDLI